MILETYLYIWFYWIETYYYIYLLCCYCDVLMNKQCWTWQKTRKKRKGDDSIQQQKGKKTRTQDLIYQVKSVRISRNTFHYFGRTKNSQIEERLTPQWMNDNDMGNSWRKHKLRGKKDKNVGKWVVVPVGEKTEDVSSSNPCIAGKWTPTQSCLIKISLLLLILMYDLFCRITVPLFEVCGSWHSSSKDVQVDEGFIILCSMCSNFSEM